jgi:hypothetical protein
MRALWDFSLRRALSLQVMGTIYGVIFWLMTIAAGCYMLFAIVSVFKAASEHDGERVGLALLMLIITPLITFVLILATRLQFEFLAAIFRIADATEFTARQSGQRQL